MPLNNQGNNALIGLRQRSYYNLEKETVMSNYTREDVIRAFTAGDGIIDHHKKDLLDCIRFLTKIKKTFTMNEIHDLLSKYGKNGRGRTGKYNTIIRAMVEMGLLISNDGIYCPSPVFAYCMK